MAFIPVNIGGGGGAPTETTLQTFTSSTQGKVNTTISDALSNYDYVKIYYKPLGSGGSATVASVIFPAGVDILSVKICGTLSSSRVYAREIEFQASRAITINNCYTATGSAGLSTDNSHVVITKIAGIK